MKKTVSVLYFSASAERLVRVVMGCLPAAVASACRLELRQGLDLLAGLELVDARGGDDLSVLDPRSDGRGVVAPARDGDRPQLDGTALPVDHPYRGLRAVLE